MNINTAYLAMYDFLDQIYKLTEDDGIGGLLGGMSLLEDGKPADAAFWQSWLESVERAEAGEVDATLRILKR